MWLSQFFSLLFLFLSLSHWFRLFLSFILWIELFFPCTLCLALFFSYVFILCVICFDFAFVNCYQFVFCVEHNSTNWFSVPKLVLLESNVKVRTLFFPAQFFVIIFLCHDFCNHFLGRIELILRLTQNNSQPIFWCGFFGIPVHSTPYLGQELIITCYLVDPFFTHKSNKTAVFMAFHRRVAFKATLICFTSDWQKEIYETFSEHKYYRKFMRFLIKILWKIHKFSFIYMFFTENIHKHMQINIRDALILSLWRSQCTIYRRCCGLAFIEKKRRKHAR